MCSHFATQLCKCTVGRMQSDNIEGSILIYSEFSVGVPWQQMSHRRHSAAWHGRIIGVWPLKDSAHQMRTPLPLSGRKGPLNSCARVCVCACAHAKDTFGCVCGFLLRHQETLLQTEFIDAAGPGELSSILLNFWLIWASCICGYLSSIFSSTPWEGMNPAGETSKHISHSYCRRCLKYDVDILIWSPLASGASFPVVMYNNLLVPPRGTGG